jgi:hypothetical protein
MKFGFDHVHMVGSDMKSSDALQGTRRLLTEGFPCAEIAHMLNSSEAAVKVRMTQGLSARARELRATRHG